MMSDEDILETPIDFGGLLFPQELAKTHFLITGQINSGKTTLLKYLMTQALYRVGENLDQRAVVYDPKLEFVSFIGGFRKRRHIDILHPFDERSVAWDMAADITDIRHARTVANIIIPTEEAEGNSRFFVNAANHILVGVLTFFILYRYERYKRKESLPSWTLQNVCGYFCPNRRIGIFQRL